MHFIKEVITVCFDNNRKHIKYTVWAKNRIFNFEPHGACIYLPLFFETMSVFVSHIMINNSAQAVGIGTRMYLV